MKKLILSALAALSLPALALATDLTITMQPPTTYEDGAPILAIDTITCNLYGANQGQPLVKLATGPCSTFTRTNVDIGVSKCYTATAVSSLFNDEGPQVTPVCLTLTSTPGPVLNLSVTPVTK